MKKLATVLAAVLLIAFAQIAFAQPYNGSGFSIELKKDGKVYYYTPEENNMGENMLKEAQAEEGLRFLNGVYDDAGELAYFLKIFEADGAADTDELLLQKFTEAKARFADYAFADPVKEELAGKAAYTASGDSVKDAAYAAKLFVTSANGKVYTLLAAYRKADGDLYYNEAVSQIGTLSFGAPPLVSVYSSPPASASSPVSSAPLPSSAASDQEAPVQTIPPIPAEVLLTAPQPDISGAYIPLVVFACVGAAAFVLALFFFLRAKMYAHPKSGRLKKELLVLKGLEQEGRFYEEVQYAYNLLEEEKHCTTQERLEIQSVIIRAVMELLKQQKPPQ